MQVVTRNGSPRRMPRCTYMVVSMDGCIVIPQEASKRKWSDAPTPHGPPPPPGFESRRNHFRHGVKVQITSTVHHRI
jgi:hypothetical protein